MAVLAQQCQHQLQQMLDISGKACAAAYGSVISGALSAGTGTALAVSLGSVWLAQHTNLLSCVAVQAMDEAPDLLDDTFLLAGRAAAYCPRMLLVPQVLPQLLDSATVSTTAISAAVPICQLHCLLLAIAKQRPATHTVHDACAAYDSPARP